MGQLKLINWELVLPLLDQLSLIQVYTTIVDASTDDCTWYSTEENRAKIAWRWQMSPSTVKYAIAKLTKKNFLTTTARGVYKLNKSFLDAERDKTVSADS